MDVSRIILESIARKTCIEANYNRTRFKLAPHILYTRHGEAYLDAVAELRNGEPPREVKLGSFKLTGFTGVTKTGDAFTPSSLYEPGNVRYEGTTLFAVE